MHDRIFRLLTRRQWLDTALRTELSRRNPDVIRLLRLKRIALVTKDRLNRLFHTAPISQSSTGLAAT